MIVFKLIIVIYKVVINRMYVLIYCVFIFFTKIFFYMMYNNSSIFGDADEIY